MGSNVNVNDSINEEEEEYNKAKKRNH